MAAILIITAIGLFCGAALALAAKKFEIREDIRVETVAGLLPGVNCGVCGYAGCAAYAKAAVLQGTPINLCVPGGVEVVKKLEVFLGRSGKTCESTVAVVLCSGSHDVAKRRNDYNGIVDCYAADIITKTNQLLMYLLVGQLLLVARAQSPRFRFLLL